MMTWQSRPSRRAMRLAHGNLRDDTPLRQFTLPTRNSSTIDIDAIYNPLPNGLHGRWTQAAIAAGKHVLCEKPFAANATEAAQVAAAAERSRLVVMEAFHYRYHALIPRLLELLSTGELGKSSRWRRGSAFRSSLQTSVGNGTLRVVR